MKLNAKYFVYYCELTNNNSHYLSGIYLLLNIKIGVCACVCVCVWGTYYFYVNKNLLSNNKVNFLSCY